MSSVRVYRKMSITPASGNNYSTLVYFTSNIKVYSKENSYKRKYQSDQAKKKKGKLITTTEAFKRREKLKRYEKIKTVIRKLNFDDCSESIEKTKNIKKSHECTCVNHKIVIENSIRKTIQITRHREDSATPESKILIHSLLPLLNVNILNGAYSTIIQTMYEDKKVAVKGLSQKYYKNRISVKNEQNGIGLIHPNVVHIFKIINYQKMKYSFVIMNYFSDTNLQNVLDNKKINIDPKNILRYSLHISQGLHYLHSQNILHLDIKPNNILIYLPAGLCKICDFGTSMNIKFERKNLFKGTLEYCSPEVLSDEYPTTASDIYSLGITFWQIIHRNYPYCGKNEGCHFINQIVDHRMRPKITHDYSLFQSAFKNIYINCWWHNPLKRLSTLDILVKIKRLQIVNGFNSI